MADAGIDAADGAHGNVAGGPAAGGAPGAPPVPLAEFHSALGEIAGAVEEGVVVGAGILAGLAIAKPAGGHTLSAGPAIPLETIREICASAKAPVRLALADGSRFDISNLKNLLEQGVGNAEPAAAPAAAASSASASSGESNARLHERKIRGLIPDRARLGPDKAPLLAAKAVAEEFAGVPSPFAPFPSHIDVTVARAADFENPLAFAVLLAVRTASEWPYTMLDRSGLSPLPESTDKLRAAIAKVKPPLHGTAPDALAFSAGTMGLVLRQVALHVQTASDFKSGGSFYQISVADVSHWATILANMLGGLSERLLLAHAQSPEDGAFAAAARLQSVWLAACSGRVYVPATGIPTSYAATIWGLRGSEAPRSPSACAFDCGGFRTSPMLENTRRMLGIVTPGGPNRRGWVPGQAPKPGSGGGRPGGGRSGGGRSGGGRSGGGRSGGGKPPQQGHQPPKGGDRARPDKRPASAQPGDIAKKAKVGHDSHDASA